MKMKTKLLGAAVALVVVGGSVTGLTVNSSAFASTLNKVVTDNPNDNDQEVADDVQQTGQEQAAVDGVDQEDNDQEVADSVEPQDNDQEVADDVEQANLQQQATITKEQSVTIASAQVQGTVKDVQLEDEDGAAVYNVSIQDGNGTITEVKVDAKTGKITKQEQGDNNQQEDQDNEMNDDQQ
jgi:uncharacterized membrane protein YkoI